MLVFDVVNGLARQYLIELFREICKDPFIPRKYFY